MTNASASSRPAPPASGPGMPPAAGGNDQRSTGGPLHTRRPVEWFKPDPKQPRKHFDDDEDRRLGEDMRAHGQYRPAGALPDGTLLYGGRQLRAARLVGLKELEVKIYDQPLTETQIRLMQWSENELRAALSDPEKSDFCAELLRLNPGWTQKDLAAHLRVSEATITHLMAVFKTIPAVQDAYRGGRLSRTDVYGISKASDPREQHALLAARLSGQLRNGQELHRQARRSRSGGMPAVRLSRVRIALPGGASIVVSGKELSMAEVVDLLAESLKEARKAAEQFDIKTFQSMMRDKSKGA